MCIIVMKQIHSSTVSDPDPDPPVEGRDPGPDPARDPDPDPPPPCRISNAGRRIRTQDPDPDPPDGSADPDSDPTKNVVDPQHWIRHSGTRLQISLKSLSV
jgi:hypothetical protein